MGEVPQAIQQTKPRKDIVFLGMPRHQQPSATATAAAPAAALAAPTPTVLQR